MRVGAGWGAPHSCFGGGLDLRLDKQPRCGEGCSEMLLQDNGTAGGDAGYSTLLYAARAVRLIEEHSFSSAGPLFLYLAFQVRAPLRGRWCSAQCHTLSHRTYIGGRQAMYL